MKSVFFHVLLLCLVLCVPNFKGPSHATDTFTDNPYAFTIKEEFDPALYTKLQSLNDLTTYIDTSFTGNRYSNNFVRYIGHIISLRFYHAYSYYSGNDNWLASMAGNYIWNDLSAIVLPDDIMKHQNAACSQQSIILMACVKYFGFSYRKVSFDHHYAVEILVGSKWHYVDPDQEVIPEDGSLQDLLHEGKFEALYKDKLTPDQIKYILAHPKYGAINESPAPQAEIFQKTTSLASSYFICLVFLIQAIVFFLYIKKDNTLADAGLRNRISRFTFSGN